MNDLVSVIVTSYNHAEYLDQRMESLLNQTFERIEIIVIDDCSTDGSINVLEKYKKYPHIQIVALKENSGYANACNTGVSLCNGDYIMFAECDDYDEPEHIEKLVKYLDGVDNIGVAFCRSKMVDSRGIIYGTDFQYREKSFKAQCTQNTLLAKKVIQNYFLISCVIPNMSAALIRKKYFNRISGLSPLFRACADWDFWCRIAEHCDFFYIRSPLNYFRTHPTTVRSTFGIALPMSEIFSLLYNAFSNLQLSFSERLRFRINVGFLWANYLTSNPVQWIRDFIPIWRHSIKYDRASIIYFLLGSGKKMYYMNRWMFRNIFNSFRNRNDIEETVLVRENTTNALKKEKRA